MEYTFIVPPEYDGKKLLAFLRGPCAVSLSLIRSLKTFKDGLTVDGARAKTDRILRAGQHVALHLPQTERGLAPCDIPVPVIFESADAIVYDKPAGMATHPTLNHPSGTLANVYAARRTGEHADSFRPITRLDKNTSGLVLAAKSRYAAPLLARSVGKRYLALCEGVIAQDKGVVNAPIARNPESIIGRCVSEQGAPSVTRYFVRRRFTAHTLLEVETLTGRTHQIRVHLAHIGHPLAGDTLYGGSDAMLARHALHCHYLHFDDPVSGETVRCESPLAGDFAEVIALLEQAGNARR